MRINTNVASLQAQEAAKNTARNQSSSLEKLGTGLQINKASDDGAGLAIADKLRTQASSINQSLSNANSASALVNIADKAMSEQSNILDTVKSKLIQAGTATTTDDGREAIRKDITKLLEQFDNISSQTNYNGITLLQKGQGTDATAQAANDGFSFQIGEDKSYDIDLNATRAVNTRNLGGGSETFSVGTDLTATSTTGGIGGGEAMTITNTGQTNFTVSSGTFDVTVSGSLGTALTLLTDTTVDFSNENADTKNLVKAYFTAAGTSVAGTFDENTMKLTTSGAVNIDFSSIDLSSTNITNSAAANSLILNNVDGVSVRNNLQGNASSSDDNIGLVVTSGELKNGDLLSSLKGLTEDGLTATKANDFMETVDEALTQLNEVRTDFGSAQNQIESSIRNLETTFTNLKAAESVIRDVDYAKESASFNKQNIIAQAGTYAMSQANAMQQNVSRLLQ